MIYYFVSLALGLFFIYSLRDMLLVIQNRRDARIAREEAEYADRVIIQQNRENCNRFERAS